MNQTKQIPGFSDYLINESGIIFNKHGKQLRHGYCKGYKIICLMKDGCKHMKRVGRLVCHAFNGKPRPDQTVDHIDGNTDNDHYTNTRWLTLRQNVKAYWARVKRL